MYLALIDSIYNRAVKRHAVQCSSAGREILMGRSVEFYQIDAICNLPFVGLATCAILLTFVEEIEKLSAGEGIK